MREVDGAVGERDGADDERRPRPDARPEAAEAEGEPDRDRERDGDRREVRAERRPAGGVRNASVRRWTAIAAVAIA
jgi:hypothetical protein